MNSDFSLPGWADPGASICPARAQKLGATRLSEIPAPIIKVRIVGQSVYTEDGIVVRKRGGRRALVACSKANAMRNNLGSVQARPKNEIPTGRPNTKPAGTVMLG